MIIMFTIKQKEELAILLLNRLREQGKSIPLESDAHFKMYEDEMMKQLTVSETKYRQMWPLKTPLPNNVWNKILVDMKKEMDVNDKKASDL